jgi:protein TonB
MRLSWLLLPLIVGCAAPVAEHAAQPAEFIGLPAHGYPPLARRREQQGEVQLRLLILANGTVGDVRIHKSSGFALLDAAAVESMSKARFSPAKNQAGRAVASWMIAPVRYVLE